MTATFSAIIMAGGRSSRMGRSKADLAFGGTTILGRIVAELRGAFPDIVIAVAPGDSRSMDGARIIHDEREYAGPLAALAPCLSAIKNDAAFVCSCDVPLVNSGVAKELCAMLAGYDAVIPEIGCLPQPLHAVYRKRCVDAIERMLARGERRLTSITQAISALVLSEEKLRAIDPELRSFFNVNTPDDYERAIHLALGSTIRRPLK